MKIQSPANIALIKHWGMHESGLPESGSASFTLSGCYTEVDIETVNQATDTIVIERADGSHHAITADSRLRDGMVWQHVQRLKAEFGVQGALRIFSKNSFPMQVGIASSASAFSALTYAVLAMGNGKNVLADKNKLSRLILDGGSASATRSPWDEMCFLYSDTVGQTLNLESVAMHKSLELVDIICVLGTVAKKVGSAEGQADTRTSPYFERRIIEANKALPELKAAVQVGNWATIRAVTEASSKLLHQTCETATEPVVYIQDNAKELVRSLKQKVDPQKFAVTFDAGNTPHIITQRSAESEILRALGEIVQVEDVIINYPCEGTRIVD